MLVDGTLVTNITGKTVSDSTITFLLHFHPTITLVKEIVSHFESGPDKLLTGTSTVFDTFIGERVEYVFENGLYTGTATWLHDETTYPIYLCTDADVFREVATPVTAASPISFNPGSGNATLGPPIQAETIATPTASPAASPPRIAPVINPYPAQDHSMPSFWQDYKSFVFSTDADRNVDWIDSSLFYGKWVAWGTAATAGIAAAAVAAIPGGASITIGGHTAATVGTSVAHVGGEVGERCRHHCEIAALEGIKADNAINAARGNMVNVEGQPFGPEIGRFIGPKDRLGAWGEGGFVEFDLPQNAMKDPNVPGAFEIPLGQNEQALLLDNLNPEFRQVPWFMRFWHNLIDPQR